LPERLLRDIGWQGVEPGTVAITAGGKNGEVGPVNVCPDHNRWARRACCCDAEIRKNLLVVIQIHVERKPHCLRLWCRDAIGLFPGLGQRGQKHAARIAMMR